MVELGRLTPRSTKLTNVLRSTILHPWQRSMRALRYACSSSSRPNMKVRIGILVSLSFLVLANLPASLLRNVINSDHVSSSAPQEPCGTVPRGLSLPWT